MSDNHLINSNQYQKLTALKKHQRVQSSALTNLKKAKLIDNNNEITNLGQQEMKHYQMYLVNDKKASNMTADICFPITAFLIMIALFIFFIFNNIGFVICCCIVLAIIGIIATPIISHYVNKHYHKN